MARRVRDLLGRRAVEAFVGRERELALLLGVLERDGPLVVHLHGIAGIGKSSLLETFSARARARGATVVRLDCRAMEPTARGFLGELGAAIGAEVSTPAGAGRRLARLGRTVVVALDNYEVFRLLDTWLRQSFVAALHDNVRLVLVGREPPLAAWVASPGWPGLVHRLELGPLDDGESRQLLRGLGLGHTVTGRIARIAQGHPLALVLAASMTAEGRDPGLEDGGLSRVLDALARTYLADVDDPVAREALDAAAVVRRMTLPLIRAMLPAAAPQDAFERLRALPFVEVSRDGLTVHEAVKQAIASGLRSADPVRYRALRLAAWRVLGSASRGATGSALWRYTADILYLLENPFVREGFFPSGVHRYAVEPARPDDGSAILSIAGRHEGPDGARALAAWWAALPASFHVVRGPDARVSGFYAMAEAACVPPPALRADPVARQWAAALEHTPRQRVLFLRRWLSEGDGEAMSPVQAACWIDVKRCYMELRPHLRRIAAVLRDPGPYAAAIDRLGFRALPELAVRLDGAVHHTAVLDFGPDSVDGWLARLVTAELGTQDDVRLDVDGREVVLDGRRIRLAPRELAVFRHLWDCQGRIVSRDELLATAWEPDVEVGSNVVDVVVRSLRRKLGDRASLLQTVHRAGYRLRV